MITLRDFVKRVKLQSLTHPGHVILVSGSSGVGKDYLASVLRDDPHINLIPGDKYGSNQGRKWSIDWPKAVKASDLTRLNIIYGVSDNMSDVPWNLVDTFVFLKPDIKLWRAINSAKAAEYYSKHKAREADFNPEGFKGWLDKSKHSPSKYEKYFKGKLEFFSDLLEECGFGGERQIVLNDGDPKKVVAGWHK